MKNVERERNRNGKDKDRSPKRKKSGREGETERTTGQNEVGRE